MTYPSPGGTSGTMRGYLVQPNGPGPFSAVLVIHENRGLNPYIEDVARRAATEGFLALAPDGLFPVGGYPGNDDDGRTLQAGLDQGKLRTDMLNSARFLKAHALSAGKLGVTGFCWGGSTTNFLAVTLGADLKAAVPFYGAAAETAAVPAIKAALLIQYAENDERINAMWPAFEAALKASGVQYEMHMYPGTQHGFHNNSTPRYQEAAAKLAWERTIAFFKKHLVAWKVAVIAPASRRFDCGLADWHRHGRYGPTAYSREHISRTCITRSRRYMCLCCRPRQQGRSIRSRLKPASVVSS